MFIATIIIFSVYPQDHDRSRIFSAVVIPVSILTSMLYANLLAKTISQINIKY